MAETSMHAGPKMRELLAAARTGTTPEQMAVRLARSTRGDLFAALCVVRDLEPEQKIDGDQLEALHHVLERASDTVQDLAEVLDDADRSARPLNLRLEPEASHG